VDTDSSDDENPDQIDQTWSLNLKKPQVADFREQIGATFQLNEEEKEIDLSSSSELKKEFHSSAIVYNNVHIHLNIFIHTFWKFA
jgi:hypothetical protein